MKASYFNNAISQHIDFNGKCRILNFDDVSIAVSPLPPLNIPEVPKSETVFASITNALELVKLANLEITQKDVDVETRLLKGLWVRSLNEPPIIAFGYIPIDTEDTENTNDERIRDVKISPETLMDPIFVEGESYLDSARNNEKVAEFLKEYSLYEWAQNPDKFGENNFIVYEGRTAKEYGVEYTDISNITPLFQLGVKHKTFYYRSKIIVPDKETIIKLLSYVRVSALNDSTLERNYKYKKYMNQSPFYKSITDFKPSKDQFIFIGKGSLVSYLAQNPIPEVNTSGRLLSTDKEINVVHTQVYPNIITPYYYRNMLIQNGRLMLIQNTRAGNFPSALAVCKEWVSSHVNVGYDPQYYPGGIYVENEPTFEVHTTEGLTRKSINKDENVTSHQSEMEPLSVFGYDNGSYAAILFL